MTYRAAVMTGIDGLSIQTRESKTLDPREVRIRVEAVGVCGSDTTYLTYGRIGGWVVDGPIILGHEAAGTVEQIGAEVTTVAVGDRVAIEPGTPCRDCRDCLLGRYHLCPDLRFLATPPYDGALAEKLVMDERNLFPIPDSMTFEEAALLEPLSVGIWACRRANLESGDRVLVVGAGPVGVLAAQVARALGASAVTVVDISDYRLGVARDLGFDTEHSGAADSADFDVLLECSGAPGALAAGLRRLRTGGRAAMVGMPKEASALPLSELNVNELTISLVNRYAHTWPTAISLVASGRVDVASLVTHRYPLEQTLDALLTAKRVPDSMKSVVLPNMATGAA